MPKQPKDKHRPASKPSDLVTLAHPMARLAAEGGLPVYAIAPPCTVATRGIGGGYETTTIERASAVIGDAPSAAHLFGVERAGMLRALYVCNNCGSTNVEHAFWANVNGEQSTNDCFGDWNEPDAVFCNACDSHDGVLELREYLAGFKQTLAQWLAKHEKDEP